MALPKRRRLNEQPAAAPAPSPGLPPGPPAPRRVSTRTTPAADLAETASRRTARRKPVSDPRPGGRDRTGAAAAAVAVRPDRNIDKVVLGDVCFRTWYPSYYGKEVVLSEASCSSADATTAAASNHAAYRASQNIAVHAGTTPPPPPPPPPLLERLYVCPHCFKYSKELVPWWEHVRVCDFAVRVPGRCIYVHPRRPWVAGKRDGDALASEEEGEWSIWEVDGEKEMVSY